MKKTILFLLPTLLLASSLFAEPTSSSGVPHPPSGRIAKFFSCREARAATRADARIKRKNFQQTGSATTPKKGIAAKPQEQANQ